MISTTGDYKAPKQIQINVFVQEFHWYKSKVLSKTPSDLHSWNILLHAELSISFINDMGLKSSYHEVHEVVPYSRAKIEILGWELSVR